MQPSRHIHMLHTALLLLALCGAGHIHNHVCLDGQEPPELVHFENLGGHPAHHADDVHADEALADAPHADVENELIPQVLLTKVPNQDSPLFLMASALLLSQRQPPQRPHYLAFTDTPFHPPPADLLPPLRAPPSHSS